MDLHQRPAWHFVVPDDVAREVVAWDPDRDPQRFASGLGHNVLELYARLRDRDLPVSIGRSIPDGTALVVYFQHAFARFAELPLALRAAPFHTAVIRSDAPLWWSNLLPADLVVVPNRDPGWQLRHGSRATHLPALPQRGLIRRDADREGIRVVAFKGYAHNVPGYLHDESFREQLERRGVTLLIDTPDRPDGGDQRWHDFHDVDVLLCVRGAASDDSLLNKPPTRLVNAWCAGVVPFVAPERAYVELVVDGVDGFVVNGPQDILSALDLLTQAGVAARTLTAIRERAREFQSDRLLDRWTDALGTASGPRYGVVATAVRRGVVIGRFTTWLARAVLRRLRSRLPLGRPGARR